MAFQICPKCRNESFYWTAEGEPYIITKWYCHKCDYTAFEDEGNERICPLCKNRTESLLKDGEFEYWWCSTCNTERPN